MPSHTREDITVMQRRKAIELIAGALVATKELVGIHYTAHERAVAIANYLEVQGSTDRLALLSLLSLPPASPTTVAARAGEGRSTIGASNSESRPA
jgi:hypothetical protein